MSTFEELEKKWDETSNRVSGHSYDRAEMQTIIRQRARKHKNVAMKYFWAAFTLQIIVYALLSHVIVRYGSDSGTLLLSLAGIIVFLPFTIVLMRRYKAMAVNRPLDESGSSLYNFVLRQYKLLDNFYRFKRRYEIILVPISSAIGTFLVFQLYFPGGFLGNQTGAVITFFVTICSCAYAIYAENKRSFREPLDGMKQLLAEFN